MVSDESFDAAAGLGGNHVNGPGPRSRVDRVEIGWGRREVDIAGTAPAVDQRRWRDENTRPSGECANVADACEPEDGAAAGKRVSGGLVKCKMGPGLGV